MLAVRKEKSPVGPSFNLRQDGYELSYLIDNE